MFLAVIIRYSVLEMDPENDHGYIDGDDFEKYLNVYAKMQVENREITFRVHTRRGTQLREIEILQQSPCKGFYLSKDDIWSAAKLLEQDASSSGSQSPMMLMEEPSLKLQRGINENLEL